MANMGIPMGLFSNQSTITSVHFGIKCTSVGKEAFKNCISLSEFNDDNVIEDIGIGAFDNCTKLKFVNIPQCTNIRSMGFANCHNLTSIDIPKVSNIEDGAFYSCSNLISVKLTPSLNYRVGNNAFFTCINLSDINFNQLVEIGDCAFMSCESLDRADLKMCSSIGSSAFYGCSNITEVQLSNCKTIGLNAFANCTNLNKVYINNIDEICELMGDYVFCTHNSSTCLINENIIFYFRPEKIVYYKSAPYWSHYANNMTMMVGKNQIIYTTTDSNSIVLNENSDIEYTNDYVGKFGVITYNNTDSITSLDKIFNGKTTLNSIDIPSECKIIEEYAFENCENLKSITLSNTLTTIQNYAFKNCKAITSFTIPDTIEELGEGIFAGCENINKIDGKFVTYDNRAIVFNDTLIYVLPKDNINSETEGRIHKISEIDENITRLGESCFQGCIKMRRVDIPSNVKEIGDNAFAGCNNLCEVHFEGNEPPTLGSDVFKDVREDFKIFVPEDKLTEYYKKWEWLSDNIYPKAKDNCVIYYSDNKLNTIDTLQYLHESISHQCPNGTYYKISSINGYLTAIPANFFSGTSVEKIILGDQITYIVDEALKNCGNLKYIYLSDNVYKLGNRCFEKCRLLSRIHIPKNSLFGDDIFLDCKNLKEFGTYNKGCVSDDNMCYIISNTLMFFAQGGLSDKNNLYTIPDNITKINRSAFRGSNIKNITLNKSVKTIGEYAFSSCLYLQSIENWDSVENISQCAFLSCHALGKISLPSNLIRIGRQAFGYCRNMYIDTNIPSSVKEIDVFAFYECDMFKCVNSKNEQVPLNLENITSINTEVFYMCKELKEVNINDNISSIGSGAFEGCSQLTKIDISEKSNLLQINKNAFKGCKNLNELFLPQKLSTINESAFENCINYKGGYGSSHQLLIPDNVSTLGVSCFKNSGVEVLKISQSSKLTEIPDSAFSDCKNLKTFLLYSESIRTIGSKAFFGCTNLCNDSLNNGILELTNNIGFIGDDAFRGCEYISSITLPLKLLNLGDYCFDTGNTNTKIFIPKGLSTPPIFSKGGRNNSNVNSNPFGDYNNSNNVTINVYYSYIDDYKKSIYWSKYFMNTYSDDINITINLNNAYIDRDYISTYFKVTKVGYIDTSSPIYLYNSAWRCDHRFGYTFKTSGESSITFDVNKLSMDSFLNNKSETMYSTLNVSIPMKTKSGYKFRIIASIYSLGNNTVSVTPDTVMLSMGTNAYNNNNDWYNNITIKYKNSLSGQPSLYLMGNNVHFDEYEDNKIPVPVKYTNGNYQILPSILYITNNSNYSDHSVQVYTNGFGWQNISDGGEIYNGQPFSLLGCIYANRLTPAQDLEQALYTLGMTSSSPEILINITPVN
jgi:hypothetical protein